MWHFVSSSKVPPDVFNLYLFHKKLVFIGGSRGKSKLVYPYFHSTPCFVLHEHLPASGSIGRQAPTPPSIRPREKGGKESGWNSIRNEVRPPPPQPGTCKSGSINKTVRKMVTPAFFMPDYVETYIGNSILWRSGMTDTERQIPFQLGKEEVHDMMWHACYAVVDFQSR